MFNKKATYLDIPSVLPCHIYSISWEKVLSPTVAHSNFSIEFDSNQQLCQLNNSCIVRLRFDKKSDKLSIILKCCCKWRRHLTRLDGLGQLSIYTWHSWMPLNQCCSIWFLWFLSNKVQLLNHFLHRCRGFDCYLRWCFVAYKGRRNSFREIVRWFNIVKITLFPTTNVKIIKNTMKIALMTKLVCFMIENRLVC